MSAYRRKGNYLVPVRSSSSSSLPGVRIVSGKNGSDVYSVGADLNGAAHPVDVPKTDPTKQLLAELEAQAIARRNK